MFKVSKLSIFFLSLLLISMAVSPAFALGEGNRNLLLIGIMCTTPLIFLKLMKFDKMDLILMIFLLFIITFPLLLHPKTVRWTTVLYSVMFSTTFISYKHLLKQNYFTVAKYLQILKYLVYAYFIVLIIQQFCVLTGLPIFNLGLYSPAYPWRLNSLAAEPSHSARIVALLMYSYIVVKEIILKKKYNFKTELKEDKWVWLTFIWTMVTMGSSTAFLFIPIVLMKFLRIKNIIPLVAILVIIFTIVEQGEIKAFERTYKTAIATLTFDEQAITEADHSASFRIVPIIVLVKMVELNTVNGWFGHGVDHVSTFLEDYLIGAPEGISGGGMFQIWIEYGFIPFILFVIFSFLTTFRKSDYLSLILWFLLVFMYGVNNQMVWLCIILLYTNKYFYKKNTNRYCLNYENT